MYIVYITGMITYETRNYTLNSYNLSKSWKYLYRAYRLAKKEGLPLRYRVFHQSADGTKTLCATMYTGHSKSIVNGFYPNPVDWTK